MRKLFSALCVVCTVLFLTGSAVAANPAEGEAEALIQSFLAYNNDQQVQEYIDLFISEERQQMEDHVEQNGEYGFFQTTNELLEVEALPYEEGLAAASVNGKELDLYGDDVIVYRTRENITVLPGFSGVSGITSGEYERAYLMCREDGVLKIIRVAANEIVPAEPAEAEDAAETFPSAAMSDGAAPETETAQGGEADATVQEDEADSAAEEAELSSDAPNTGEFGTIGWFLAFGVLLILACVILTKQKHIR